MTNKIINDTDKAIKIVFYILLIAILFLPRLVWKIAKVVFMAIARVLMGLLELVAELFSGW
jgi:energy-coupling factor transporter transmembrane protein EcfT